MVRPQSMTENNSNAYEDAAPVGNKRRFKGVRMRKWGKWVAEVRQPNSRDRIWLGSYDTPEEAARAYDAAAFCLRGPTTMLNFPDDPPQIQSAGELSPPQIQAEASRHARRSTLGVDSAVTLMSSSANNVEIVELKPTVMAGARILEDCCGELSNLGADRDGGNGGDGRNGGAGVSVEPYFETPSVRTF